MRNIKRWLAFALCALMLCNCFGTRALAAENESPVTVYAPQAAPADGEVTVQLAAAEADTVADGKLALTYDPAMLTYVGTETGSAWHDGEAVTLSVNAAEGRIVLAFASAEAAEAGCLFALTFKTANGGGTRVALDSSSYVSGADAKVEGGVTIMVSEAAIAVTLRAGDHGVFADGAAETTVHVLPEATVTATNLAPVTPDRGYALTGWMTADGTVYALDELSLTAEEGMVLTAQYTFVCAGGRGCPSAQFVDMRNMIPLIHEAVDYMVEHGYMNGMDSTHFGPNLELNRAMMVTILYRIAGSPDAAGTHDFVDVPDDQFYTEPVIWAVSNGITNGIDATHFAPGKSLTRQELVTFLYRFAGVMGYDRTAETDLSGYTDLDKVQPYALEAFRWAVASGVVNGTSATTLSPENTTTRAQICIMVSRLLKAQN